MSDVNTIYTIGYSSFRIDDLIKRLRQSHVSALIDVRSTPYSGRFPEYNRENLASRLREERIYYKNYAKEFGARQDNLKYYPHGYLDFELFVQSPDFKSGFDKLTSSMDQGYIFALMCSEKDPVTCHRAIMVSRQFHLAGYNVIHFLPGNENCTQKDVEQRLLKIYFPKQIDESHQLDLFEEQPDEAELIAQAYRKQNEKIGYRIEEVV